MTRKSKKNTTKSNVQRDRKQSSGDNDTPSVDKQIVDLCRLYLHTFRPFSELINENNKLSDAIIPQDLTFLTERYIIPTLYNETLDKIRALFEGQNLFITFSSSCNGHCTHYSCDKDVKMVNVSMGVLQANESGPAFIINSVERDFSKVDGSDFYYHLFWDTLKILWPKEKKRRERAADILHFVSECNPDIYEAYTQLAQNACPMMLYQPCLEEVFREETNSYLMCYWKGAYACVCEFSKILDLHLCDPDLEEFSSSHNLLPLPYDHSKVNPLDLAIYIFDHYEQIKKIFEGTNNLACLHKPEVRRQFCEIKALFLRFFDFRKLLRQTQPRPPVVEIVEALENLLNTWAKWRGFEFLAINLRKLLSEDNLPVKTYLSFFLSSNVERQIGVYATGHYTPLTALNRTYYFPKFQSLLQISQLFPLEHFRVFNTIYSYFEETNQDEHAYDDLIKRINGRILHMYRHAQFPQNFWPNNQN